MLLVYIGIASLRQFQCAHTTHVDSINQCFSLYFFQKLLNYIFTFFKKSFSVIGNEHVEMNKFLCSMACTWMTIIDRQFYIIDSLSEMFLWNEMLNWWLPGVWTVC